MREISGIYCDAFCVMVVDTVGIVIWRFAVTSPGISDVAYDVDFAVVELRDLLDLGDAIKDL